MKNLILSLVAFICFINANSYSQEKGAPAPKSTQEPVIYRNYDPLETSHTHDGFYASVGYGGVFGEASCKLSGYAYGGSKMTYGGTGEALDIRIGGALNPNLILHATIISAAVEDPTLSTNDYGYGDSYSEGAFGEVMFGGGLTYYFMPVNAYISGSIGSGCFVFLDGPEGNSRTERGISFNIKAGYEFWISSECALGVNTSYLKTNLSSNDSYSSGDWDSNRFTLGLNLTYN